MSDDYRKDRRDLPSRGEVRHHAGAHGSRGGSTLSLAMAQTLFERWKVEEYGWLKARILLIAKKHDEYHADYLASVEMSQRNLIGASVSALTTQRLLRSTGEHRVGKTVASHGRRSYVYQLTKDGQRMVDLHRADLIALAEGPPQSQQQALFG